MISKEITLSEEFKTQTTKAILAIIFFFVTYILLLALAVGLTIFCMYAGLLVIIARPMFLTIALGAGLASLGVLILIFLLKFIFKSHKTDRFHLIEIKKADEPKLFALIDDIVKQVGTDFPKRVYLSADVNAAVFYDSNFWSMILPVKKNLQIGLGLVNAVDQDELKAILAHEFGHFSQKTMKVGSYVYNVNQVIFNMLYDDESFQKLVTSWASAGSIVSLFVILAIRIIEGIRWVLRQLYSVVNKSYMGLSREMEFHADEIAANVTGYEPLTRSLLRLSFADHSFHNVLGFYEGKFSENLKSENLYKDQTFVMNFIAKEWEMPFEHDLPQASVESLNKFNKSKLVIKDQWASHPSTEDRVARLEKTNLTSNNANSGKAGELFQNIEAREKELTELMFSGIKYEGTASFLGKETFQTDYVSQYEKNTFSKIYNNYYDNKNPIPFDLDSLNEPKQAPDLETLFSDEMVDIVYTAVHLENDLATLKQISEKTIPIKTFDYDGKKYKRKECPALISQLDKEFNELQERIKQNDIQIYQFFEGLEKTKKNTSYLATLYRNFFAHDKVFEAKYEIYNELQEKLQFVSYNTPHEQITKNFLDIETLEFQLKKEIKEMLQDTRYTDEISDATRKNFESYVSKQWEYFAHQDYNNDNLTMLFSAINDYAFLLSRGYFLMKKEVLHYQKGLLD